MIFITGECTSASVAILRSSNNGITIDFAHPNMVPGHPLKGGNWNMTQGMLLNPEIKRFAIASPLFFKPVRPGAGATDVPETKEYVENAQELLKSYTGSSSAGTSEKCQAYGFNLDRCFANAVKAGNNPDAQCQYYVQRIKHEACSS